jgi:hypothetical protein
MTLTADLVSENAILKAELATARLFIAGLEKDERWAERARAMLAVLSNPDEEN